MGWKPGKSKGCEGGVEGSEEKELPAEEYPHGLRKKLTALKDFCICHNEYFLNIKQGDDLSSVPEIYLENLKTEGVI